MNDFLSIMNSRIRSCLESVDFGGSHCNSYEVGIQSEDCMSSLNELNVMKVWNTFGDGLVMLLLDKSSGKMKF